VAREKNARVKAVGIGRAAATKNSGAFVELAGRVEALERQLAT
jgi:hypothetical protein